MGFGAATGAAFGGAFRSLFAGAVDLYTNAGPQVYTNGAARIVEDTGTGLANIGIFAFNSTVQHGNPFISRLATSAGFDGIDYVNFSGGLGRLAYAEGYENIGRQGENAVVAASFAFGARSILTQGSRLAPSAITRTGIADDLVTGAGRIRRQAGDPLLRRIDGAEDQYATIRSQTQDIDQIARHTGISRRHVARIKQHVFQNEQILDNGVVRRFDADYRIADAWNRASTGVQTIADLRILRHELFEATFTKVFRSTYRVAHDAANRARYPSGLQ